MLRVASTMGESLIWQPAIYLPNKFSRLAVASISRDDPSTGSDLLTQLAVEGLTV